MAIIALPVNWKFFNCFLFLLTLCSTPHVQTHFTDVYLKPNYVLTAENLVSSDKNVEEYSFALPLCTNDNSYGTLFTKQSVNGAYIKLTYSNRILTVSANEESVSECYLLNNIKLHTQIYLYISQRQVSLLWTDITGKETFCHKHLILPQIQQGIIPQFLTNHYAFNIGPFNGCIGLPDTWYFLSDGLKKYSVEVAPCHSCDITSDMIVPLTYQKIYNAPQLLSRFKRATGNCIAEHCKNGGSCDENKCACVQQTIDLSKFEKSLVIVSGWTGANCTEDLKECKQKPCLHGGSCTEMNGSFACTCGHQNYQFYTGLYCQNKVDQCTTVHAMLGMTSLPVCLNGTCKEVLNRNLFECTCFKGYKGRRCEVDIDECEPEPCKNGATCDNLIGEYKCNCKAGWTGVNCTENIDECAPIPCKNNGKCKDKIADYECDCKDTGFKGDNCTINIDDCVGVTCQNSGSCVDGVKDYNCSCKAGFEGKHCEVDIDECASKPCKFHEQGSLCLQKSKRSYYEVGSAYRDIYPFNGTFSLDAAAGYVCKCAIGSEGANCETNINDCKADVNCNKGKCFDLLNKYRCDCDAGYEGTHCDKEINECDRYSPCKNGAGCEDKIADWKCTCKQSGGKQWGGKNCTVELTQCNSSPCKNSASCRPVLLNESSNQQDYNCQCTPGWTGKNCTDVTLMSFNGSSTLTIDRSSDSKTLKEMKLSYRTTLRNAVILQLTSGSNQITLSTVSKKLILKTKVGSAAETSLEVLTNGNSGSWINMTLSLANNKISIQAVGGSKVVGDFAVANFANFKGFVKEEFRGCLQDIIFQTDSKLPVTISVTWITLGQVTTGSCPRVDQCSPNPCSASGTLECIDLWNDYQCVCKRPYYYTKCGSKLKPVTFGFNGTKSYVQLNVATFSTPVKDFIFSFFLTTREQDAFVAYFGSKKETATKRYLSIEMIAGILKASLKLSARTELSSTVSVNTGDSWFVLVQRQGGKLVLSVVKGSEFTGNTADVAIGGSSAAIGGRSIVTVSASETITIESFYLGGASIAKDPVPPIRVKRSISEGAFSNNVRTLRGLIQDPEFNTKKLVVFDQTPAIPASVSTIKPVTGAEGKVGVNNGVKNDPVCEQLGQPCQNGGNCSNVDYNDYKCDCDSGWKGRNCTVVDHCFQRTQKACPTGSKCVTLEQGFECQVAMTFNATTLAYLNTFNSSLQKISKISMKLRTRTADSELLLAQNKDKSSQYIIVLAGGKINVQYGSASVKMTSLVNTADWFQVSVTLTPKIKVDLLQKVNTTYWKDLESQSASADTPALFSVHFVYLNRKTKFEGCMDDVRMDGNLLPAYFSDKMPLDKTPMKFELTKDGTTGDGARAGCHGKSVCLDTCKHGGKCNDLFNTYKCDCKRGYTGDKCNIVNCTKVDCRNNADCQVDSKGAWKCVCPGGWTGERCTEDKNECKLSTTTCKNGGNCTNLQGDFNCTCPVNYVGKTCYSKDPCRGNPCKNGVCTMKLEDAKETAYYSCECNTGWEKGKTNGAEICDTKTVKAAGANMWLIIGICLAIVIVAIVVVTIFLVQRARTRRAGHGVYNPSKREVNGGQLHLNQVLKPPPEERLI